MDIRLPPTFRDEGLRAALELRKRAPETAVLVVSQYVEHSYAAELLADGRGGIGYLLKDRIMNVDEFVDAVRTRRSRRHRNRSRRRRAALLTPALRTTRAAHASRAGSPRTDGRRTLERGDR